MRVYNNGDGVPVEMHKEEGVYVPELIFGHLLTSSNYNEDEKKVCGGTLVSQSAQALVQKRPKPVWWLRPLPIEIVDRASMMVAMQ